MNCIIIEDERFAAARLEQLLAEIDSDIKIIEIIDSVESAVRWLTENKVDLIFMDINLSDGICFEIFSQTALEAPVIFTTAFDQYAIQAFKCNGIDYLLKPIRKQELSEALHRYKKTRMLIKQDFEELSKSLISRKPVYKKRFLIDYGGRIKKVEIDEVSYFYALEKNVFLITFDKQTYPLDLSLDRIMEMLDPDQYFRINRKMIINYKGIKSMLRYSKARVLIELQPQAPEGIDPLVSVERAADFRKWMDK